jgi:hypothetical protein
MYWYRPDRVHFIIALWSRIDPTKTRVLCAALPVDIGGFVPLRRLGRRARELGPRPSGEADPDPTAATTLR